MLTAAITGEPSFSASRLEIDRPLPSYSIETVEQLRAEKAHAKFFFLVGEDNLPQLPSWHRFDELRRLVQFIVLDRSRERRGALPCRAEKNRHFSDDNPKSSCQRPIDSLSRTRSSRANHPPGKTLPRSEPITPEEIAKTCAQLAADKKAEEIVVLDLREISTFTDFFVLCSGTSEPHLKAIASEIETRLREDYSVRPAAIDGFPRRATGSCSITCRSSCTSSTARNGTSTAWKTSGAMLHA